MFIELTTKEIIPLVATGTVPSVIFATIMGIVAGFTASHLGKKKHHMTTERNSGTLVSLKQLTSLETCTK
jgi:hypothetical protein